MGGRPGDLLDGLDLVFDPLFAPGLDGNPVGDDQYGADQRLTLAPGAGDVGDGVEAPALALGEATETIDSGISRSRASTPMKNGLQAETQRRTGDAGGVGETIAFMVRPFLTLGRLGMRAQGVDVAEKEDGSCRAAHGHPEHGGQRGLDRG